MGASCRGICIRYQNNSVANNLKYQQGFKRCTFCGLFLKTTSVRCPCCNLILRTHSRVNPKRKNLLLCTFEM